MVDVAGGIVNHHNRDTGLELILDLLGKTAVPVSGNNRTSDGIAVVGNVTHDGSDATVLNDLHNADSAVKVAFGAVDFGIAPAGVGDDGAVFHEVATDKAVGVVVN